MATPSKSAGHSARVSLELILSDRRLPLSQVAPDWIIAVSPEELGPCTGQLFMSIDGHEQITDIHLPQGMSANDETTPMVRMTAKVAPAVHA